MKNQILLFALLVLAFFALTSVLVLSETDQNRSTLTIASPSFDNTGFIMVTDDPEAFTYKSLYLVPIRADENYLQRHVSLGHYLTLKEATEKNLVMVTERIDTSPVSSDNQNESQNEYTQLVSSGEMVNTLYIENVSDDTVFIMAGELVKGGKQDRLIAKDFLLHPKSGKVDLTVYCVESGRWTYADGNADGVSNLVVNEVQFSSSGIVATNTVRKTAMKEKDQSKVWDEVEVVTEKNDAVSNSGTYNALEEAPEYQNKLDDYLKFFEHKFDQSTDIIGVVAMNGNKVIGCDIFCKPDLFRREFGGLLHAYITEVITDPVKDKTDMQKVSTYFEKVKQDYSDDSEKTLDQKLVNAGKVIHFTSFEE